MIFQHFLTDNNESNVYVVGCEESREAVIIDAGAFPREIEEFIDKLVESEAEDIEVDPAEMDEASDLLKLPYTDQFIEEMRSDLRRQLSKLGLDEADLRILNDKDV